MSNDIRVQNMIALISQNEEFMTAFKAISQHVAVESGDPSFARFSQALIEVSRQEVKPLFGDVKAASRPNKANSPRKDKAPVDNTWREEQKNLFSGRGFQWVYVSLDDVKDVMKEDDVVTPYFRKEGQAWVRYAGPRIVDGVQMAAFELRESGSKHPSPKNLVYISHQDVMDGEFTRLPDGKTPFELGLESDAPRKEETKDEGIVVHLDGGGMPEVMDDEVIEMMQGDEEEIDDSIF